MRNIKFSSATNMLRCTLLAVVLLSATTGQTDPSAKPKMKWAIVLHGGAGAIPKGSDPKRVAAYRAGLSKALRLGKKILSEGGSSLNAVEAVIRELEDNPLFNAGKGAVFNSAGGHELDASIMDGSTLRCGAVAGVRRVRNPITLARRVMEKTRHVLLAGEGAEVFAKDQKVAIVEPKYFSTPYRRRQWEQRRKRDAAAKPRSAYFGTVGCVAIDGKGNIAAGTSTGGLTNKKFGRIGDSPIVGAGTYANNRTCGVSGTGIGEEFIRHSVAAQISLLMEHGGKTLREAATFVMTKRLKPNTGGVVAVDHKGNIVWVFTTRGMYRAAADSAGRFDVHIWEDAKSKRPN